MSPDLSPLISQTQQTLSQQFDTAVTITDYTVLTHPERRNRLVRIHCQTESPQIPVTLIIKQATGEDFDLNNPDSDATQGFFNDWAGIEFLSALPEAQTAHYSPRFYGGQREMGFMLMEDLGSAKRAFSLDGAEQEADASLVQPLLNPIATEAEAGLMALGRSLGRIHAVTIGREPEYADIRSRLGPPGGLNRQKQGEIVRELAQSIPQQCQALGFSPSPYLSRDILKVAKAMAEPGPFLAYTHGDPCPDNCVYVDGQFRLLDFELSDFRHALLDAAFGRISFPTCWCCNQVPQAVVERMEAVYRTELIKACPQAGDDQLFGQALVEACAFWVLFSLDNLPTFIEKDSQWGIAMVRPRILTRLETMHQTAEQFQHLPALSQTCAQLRETLQHRWSESADLPLYPAFR